VYADCAKLGGALAAIGKYEVVTDSLASLGAGRLSTLPLEVLLQLRSEWAAIVEAAR
jgi:hypothetical protein